MFADPIKNLKAFDLRENMIIADLGAGSGFYAIPAASFVAKGKVYAIEIQKDYLTKITNNARHAGIKNIVCLLGDIEKKGGTKIKDKIIDAAIASNVLFQVEDKNNFIEEVKRILKPGGRLLLVDIDKSAIHTKTRMIPKEKAKEMFEQKGFVFERYINTGDHHYGIIFTSR